MSTQSYTLEDLDATRRLASKIAASSASQQLTLALNGSLGTGKTQFVRFLAGALGIPTEEVTSPTYVLIQQYVGRRTIYHFDFYRLNSEAEVWDLGLDEILEMPVMVVIEWANKFPSCLPDDHLEIELRQSESGSREAQLRPHGPRAKQLVNDITDR